MDRRPLFALATAVLLAVAGEGAARALGPGLLPADRSPVARPGEPTAQEPNMVGDADSGWRPRTGPQQSFGIPGGTVVNSHGLRAPEVAEAKSRPRVIVVGDSSVFGVFVRDADTFAARVGAAFPGVEVLNAGVPGYSSWQALRALDGRLKAYAPDLVVVATLWSDTQGADLPDSVRFGSDRASVLEKSHAFVLLREWVREARWGGQAEKVGFGLGMPVAPTTRVPLSQYETNLRAFASRAPAIAFLMLPCIRDPAAGRVGDFRDAYRAAMREAAAELGAPLVDTPQVFVGTDPKRMFHDEVHPTAEGNRVIAEALQAALAPWVEANSGGRASAP
jgi:lysophospholipase L1-like esterase